MDDQFQTDPIPPKFSFLTRIMIWIAGCDEKLLRECPTSDLGYVQATALLYLGVLFYQTLVLAIVAHVLFAPDGQIHPPLVAGALFIGILIYLIDSYAFLRGGHFSDGIRALLKGGIDIGDGILGKFRSAAFLVLRILFSVALALLTGIWVGMIIFNDDIIAHLDAEWRTQNSGLIQAANARVDARIRGATDLLKSSTSHLTSLQSQLDAAQNGIVDPASEDIGVDAEQSEFQQLLIEKTAADRAEEDAQNLASGELGGENGPGLSGRPGVGPRRLADLERLKAAQADDTAITNELNAARGRLDKLRSQIASGAGDRAGSAKAMLPQLQSELQAQTAEVGSQRQTLTQLSDHRDQAVQEEIQNAPEYVAPDHGMLARLSALKDIANKDHEIAAVILLIDIASMGLELAAVVVKITTFIPTVYCPLLAKICYLNTVKIVDEMDAALRRKPSAHDSNEEPAPDPLPPIAPAGRGGPGAVSEEVPTSEIFPLGSVSFGASGPVNGATPRPRGRPRKNATFN